MSTDPDTYGVNGDSFSVPPLMHHQSNSIGLVAAVNGATDYMLLQDISLIVSYFHNKCMIRVYVPGLE
jgi:hypothetical protein